MSSNEDGYNYVGQNFVIENGLLKGATKEIDLSDIGVGEVILKHMADTPDHVGQIDADTEKSTTHAEMRESAIRCATWLKNQCISKGDVITVCTHNHLDAYIPCIATFLIGAAYNPWHHEVTLKEARYFMNLTEPKVIFVCESAVKTLKEAARLENHDPTFVVFGDDPELKTLKDILKLQSTNEVEDFVPEACKDRAETAIIFFSSGTTGLPKGVALSYYTLVRIVTSASTFPTRNLNLLWYSSLYWISGTLLIFQTIMSTATRIVHSNPEEMCKIIEKFKVNFYFLTPSMVAYFCRSNVFDKHNLDSLKILMIAGAKVSREILIDLKTKVPHVAVTQAYGMTELGAAISFQTPGARIIESVGFVMPNVQVKVVDVDTGKILGPNQPGECCVKVDTVMIGYYKNPAATKAMIDDEGWIHTGDKVYYSEEGEIVIVDRIKEVMKFRGHHVSPYELEEVLLRHPGVMEAAVVPLPHSVDLERPMAFVKRVPGADVTEEELVEMTSELGEFKKLWGGVKFLNDMPYTASGKISRRDLKEMAKALSNFRDTQ